MSVNVCAMVIGNRLLSWPFCADRPAPRPRAKMDQVRGFANGSAGHPHQAALWRPRWRAPGCEVKRQLMRCRLKKFISTRVSALQRLGRLHILRLSLSDTHTHIHILIDTCTLHSDRSDLITVSRSSVLQLLHEKSPVLESLITGAHHPCAK